MEIQQTRSFIAVAEELHFGRAAQRLQVSQSALSRSLAQLERSLGSQLVERTTRSVALTAAGHALLPHAQELVAMVDRSADIVAEATEGRTGRVRLGFAGPSTNQVVGSLARKARQQLPGLELRLVSSMLSHLGLQQVLDGELDIALGRWDALPANIESTVVSYERLIFALPDRHRLAAHSSISIVELRDDNWVVLPSGPGAALPQRLHLLAGGAGFMPTITQIAPDAATSMVLVASGYGVSLTQSSVQEHMYAPGVVFREITESPPPLPVRLIWRRDSRNAALVEVIDVANRLFP